MVERPRCYKCNVIVTGINIPRREDLSIILSNAGHLQCRDCCNEAKIEEDKNNECTSST